MRDVLEFFVKMGIPINSSDYPQCVILNFEGGGWVGCGFSPRDLRSHAL